jgi:hypothetical protein
MLRSILILGMALLLTAAAPTPKPPVPKPPTQAPACLALPGSILALSCPQSTWDHVYSIRANTVPLIFTKVFGVEPQRCKRGTGLFKFLVKWDRVDGGPSYTCDLRPEVNPQ